MSSKSSITNLLYLSIPIFFANLALPLVAIVDTGLMGNQDDASYLTATSIASSVFSMIFLSFGFLRMGTVGMVAQAYGSNQYNEIIDGEYAEGAISSENFSKTLNKIDKDKSIKGLFLRVNSPGGSGFASEIIRQRLAVLNKQIPIEIRNSK